MQWAIDRMNGVAARVPRLETQAVTGHSTTRNVKKSTWVLAGFAVATLSAFAAVKGVARINR
jgi:hypothetical protein